jgi:hypothetical protein
MGKRPASSEQDVQWEYRERIEPLVRQAPWVLRVTEHKDKPSPVLVIRQRFFPAEPGTAPTAPVRTILKDRGFLYGPSLRRCLPVLRSVVSRVCDPQEVPLDLQRFLAAPLAFRGNLPLDPEAGAKLALVFKLQERIQEMDRVELIAWRVERFTREEAEYWLTRITQYGEAASRWALAGMRIMLGGQPGDLEVGRMLNRLRR